MSDGLEQLSQHFSGVQRKVLFHKLFPNVTYARSTLYRHIAIYRRAKEHHLLKKYVDAGNTDEGLWSTMIKELPGKSVDPLPRK